MAAGARLGVARLILAATACAASAISSPALAEDGQGAQGQVAANGGSSTPAAPPTASVGVQANSAKAKGGAAKAAAKKTTQPAPADRAAAMAKALGLPKGFQLSASDQEKIAAGAQTVSRLNKFLIKGYDVAYPGYDDSIFQDYGGFRSALAEYGFGFNANTTVGAAFNMLDAPRNGPGPKIGVNQFSNQQYWGQQPSGAVISTAGFTYDLSRWGVPDGQFTISGVWAESSWDPNYPSQIGMQNLSWYQTLFDKAVEIKVGYIANISEWIGIFTGGSFTSPLGSAATVPFEMGLSAAGSSQPTARVTWHITDTIYNQAGIMRSLPINGATGSPLIDNSIYNPANVNFNVPNGGMLLMDEVGYRTRALPGQMDTWIRGGVIYNDSDFVNYQTGGTSSGLFGGYILGDVQLLQFDSSSIFTAYRGLYVGGSAMWGPEANIPLNEYYEGRIYIKGPFDSRPRDQLTFTYRYNGVSQYLRAYVDKYSPYTGVFANTTSQSYLLAYTAQMTKGIYTQVGVSYSENPSVTYTKNEGSALALVFSAFVNY